MKIKANPNAAIDPAVAENPAPQAENDTLANRIMAMIVSVRFVVETVEKLSSFV
jgi:hypothetical protein